jgi:hypothetical protein
VVYPLGLQGRYLIAHAPEQCRRPSAGCGCVAKAHGKKMAFVAPEDRLLFQAAIPNRLLTNRARSFSQAGHRRFALGFP